MNPVRKLKLTSREEGRKPTNSDKVLGKGAKKGLLMSRACPNFEALKGGESQWKLMKGHQARGVERVLRRILTNS